MKCNPLRWLLGLVPLALIWWLGLLGTQQRVEADIGQRVREHLDRNGLQWADVAFKGRDGLISGRAEEESDQRRPALEASKVWGVRALEDRIEVLQSVKNYVWTAAVRGGDLALGGYVPNEAARKAILASARSSLPKLRIDDKMELARGAPEQKTWLGGTAFALRQLAALKPGARASMEGAALTVEGEADTSRNYESVRTALSANMPAGINLKSERIIPPVINPYTWGANLRGRQIELTGHAPSVAARNEIKSAAERALPGGTVVDRMTLASGAPNDWQKVVTGALARLGQLRQGTAETNGTELTVNGLAETEETATRVRTALRSDLPASYRLSERIIQDPAVKAAEDARRAAEETARRNAAAAAAAAAEAEARRTAELQRQQGDEQSRLRAAEEAARRRAEEEAVRQRQAAEEAARKRAADEAARKATAEADAQRRAAEEKAKAAAAAAAQAEAQTKARAAELQRCQADLTAATEGGTILFQRASAEIDRRSYQTLDALARIVKSCPGYMIEVGGHTDNEGEPGRNQRLSERRANAVLDYLVRTGVPTGTLAAVGYGEVRPKVPNDSPVNMAKNRRIEFSVKAR